MMHKIRSSIGKLDALYTLKGAIEFDEGYFEKATSSKVKLKRGRGSQKQINVAVMSETTPLEDIDTGYKSSQCQYFKIKVVGNHNSAEIDQLVSENFDQKSIVFSDKSTSYVNISGYVETHISVKSDNNATKTTLKWVHRAISNPKQTLIVIYHKIKGKYLQHYLDKFCYKLNRRYFGEKLFNRLVLAIAKMY